MLITNITKLEREGGEKEKSLTFDAFFIPFAKRSFTTASNIFAPL